MFAEGVRDLALPDLHVHPPLHPPRRPQPLDLHVSGRYHLFRVFLTKTPVTFLFLCIALHEYDAPGRSGRPRQFVILSPAARKEKSVSFSEIFWTKIQIHANRIGTIAV